MELLRALQTIRTPLGDALAAGVTTLGEETAFMAAGLLILWCISKKWGFRLLLAGLAGTTLNQLLKAIFLIPRPWVIDPSFSIVEAARAEATGYSFPSGHTQSAAMVFGMLAVWLKTRRVTVLCVAAVLLVGFSRMYLGVHTPLDVGVSLATGILMVLLMAWLFERVKDNRRGKIMLGLASLGFAMLLLAYVLFMPPRAESIAEFDAHGVKSAWTLVGTVAGLLLAWWIDDRYTHFETRATWWAQVLKVLIGIALVMGVRVGLKPVLAALFDDSPFTDGIRYCATAVVGGALWPMTFGFWSRSGAKKAEKEQAI